ncbi:hypothetical protein MHU86_4554 [Fragilaria crotonensis]|nr:hypothetical protein MHU86_4554 [Fragilaria crotonensis]
MGLEASRLLAIDMLKGLCDGGVNVPLTEDDCFDKNGEIDNEKFEEYLMQEDYEDEEKRKLLLALANMVGESARKRKRGAMADAQRRIRAAKKTRVARSRWYTDPVTRVKRKKTPKMSAWWEDFIQDPRPEDKHWAKEFRQNFRLPYASYVMLLDMISSDASIGLFDRWIKAYESTTTKTKRFRQLNCFSWVHFVIWEEDGRLTT